MYYDYDVLLDSEIAVLKKMGIEDKETYTLLAEHTVMIEGQLYHTDQELIKAKRIINKLFSRLKSKKQGNN
jgi:hypothetical protein